MFDFPRMTHNRDTDKLPTEGSLAKHGITNEISKGTLAVDDSRGGNVLHAKSSGSVGILPHRSTELGGLSKQETHSLVLSNKSQDGANKEDEFLSSLVMPFQSHTKEGKGSFEGLYLPPLPAFDISNISATLSSKTTLSHISSNGSLLSSNRDTLGRVPEGEVGSFAPTTQSSETVPSASDLPITASQSRKKLTGQESLVKIRKSNSKTFELSKEKLTQAPREKYCPTGI